MEKPSTDVLTIVENSLSGAELSHADALRLCEVEPFTPDYYVLRYAMRKLTYRASGGIAEAHGQIGMDANPCATGNCDFCSFAVSSDAHPNVRNEMPRELILKYARQYWEAGANCLTLMITADYNFDQYLGHVEAIHNELPDFPIMANIGDFDVAMAEQLRAVGVGSVYHAIRMGEGEITAIPLETRIKSIEAAHAAGLKVATCMEGIRPEYTYEEIVSALELSESLKPECGFAGTFIAVPGTKMFGTPHYSGAKVNVFAAIRRMLAGGDRMPFGNGNLSWAEVGTNPRDNKTETEKDGLGSSIYKERMYFEEREWTVPEGPSQYW